MSSDETGWVSSRASAAATWLFVATLLPTGVTGQPSAPMKVRTSAVVEGPIAETLPITGSVTSPNYTALASRVDGVVAAVLRDAGARVELDEPLLEIDRSLAELELKRLQASLAEARHLHTDSVRRAEEAGELVERNLVSRTEYESLLAQAAARKAGLVELESRIATQTEQLRRHTVRAPFAGVVAERMTNVGQWVRADTPVLRLVQMNPLQVDVRVPERFLGLLDHEAPVRVALEAQPEHWLESMLAVAVPVADTETRTFLARVVLPNPDWRIAPGMSARVQIALNRGTSHPVLQVPADAIVRRPGGDAVVWVVRDGAEGAVAESVGVVLGRRNGTMIEIDGDGLAAGQLVVTLGNESLRPGQSISVVN